MVALFVLLGAPAQATVLIFDEPRSATGDDVVPIIAGATLPQDYGDGEAGASQAVPGGTYTHGEAGEGHTPNIQVEYFASNSAGADGVQMWTIQYGDLEKVLFVLQGAQQLNIRLAADPGSSALLYGFDLAGWPEAEYLISGVTVSGDGQVLFSESDVLVQGAGQEYSGFSFANPLTAAELLISIDFSNLAFGQQDNIGLDNLRFGQTPPAPIPEPATWLQLLAGLSILALARCHPFRG